MSADSRENAPSLMLVAGEASGDLHAAALARELKRSAPEWRLIGMGGARMAEAGVELFHDLTTAAVVGWTEAISRLPALFQAFKLSVEQLKTARPRALVLADFPEFNIRLARRAHRLGVPVVYFIPPQIWAWRRWRVRVLRRHVTKLLTLFPFENDFYGRARVPVEFIGHPLLDELPPLTREGARGFFKLLPDEPLIGLLPGSRREEVARLLPVMLQASAEVVRRKPGARALVALAPTVGPDDVRPLMGGSASFASVVEGETYRVMAAADCLLVASGTATLEAACFGTPMVVCYKTSRLTYCLAWIHLRVPWISLANIVAGREVVPELIQGRLTVERLTAHALSILDDRSTAKAQRDGLALVRGRLGSPGACERAAKVVLKVAGHPEFIRERGTA